MSLHLKYGNEWVEATRPYIKINGSWVPGNFVYVKQGGAWVVAYQYDSTPPETPELSLSIVKGSPTTQHIKVGVKVGTEHDPELKRIRVLTNTGSGYPSTQYGGTFTSTPQEEYPNEPWSEFYFNGHGGSSLTADSSQYRYKTWTPNASSFTNVLSDRSYYFSAWAEDVNGNWSSAGTAEIRVDPISTGGGGGGGGTPSTSVLAKSESFRAYTSGSYTPSGYSGGLVIQSDSPRSRGLYFYADDIKQKVGKEGTPKIKSAQIYVHRRDDSGKPNADLWLFWHDYGYPGQIGGTLNTNGITHLGRISKGEAKWFNLPANFIAEIEAGNLKGFGFNYKDRTAAVTENDYSVLKAVDDKPRAGEVNIVWEETL